MNPILGKEWIALSYIIRLYPYFTYYTSVVYISILLKNLIIHQHLKEINTFSLEEPNILHSRIL